MFIIHKPLWNGNRQRCVGLADYRLALEGNVVEIQIDYKSQEGLRLYPDPLYIRKTDAVKYPPQNASGTKVYVIPICNLSTTPDMGKKYVEYDLACPKCETTMRQNLSGVTVSYVCEKCGAKSAIEWEFDKPKASKPVLEPPGEPESIKPELVPKPVSQNFDTKANTKQHRML